MYHLPVANKMFLAEAKSLTLRSGYPTTISGENRYLVVPDKGGQLSLIIRDPLCYHEDPAVREFAQAVEKELLAKELGLVPEFFGAHRIRSIVEMTLPKVPSI